MMETPSRRPSRTALSSQAYDILKRQIVTCVLQPGQRLIEKEICQSLAISRTPLREALNRLDQEGLVRMIPFCGFVVSRLTSEDVADLFEFRCILETEAAALAAVRASPEECAWLQKVADILYVPGDRKTYEGYLESNMAFHSALARCTHNRKLELSVISVMDQIQRALYSGLDFGMDPESATAEHLELADAVRVRDPSRARMLATKQIRNMQERILGAMRAQEDSMAEPEDFPHPVRQ
jgi:DNA-binding GntR family transcriptional regulator